MMKRTRLVAATVTLAAWPRPVRPRRPVRLRHPAPRSPAPPVKERESPTAADADFAAIAAKLGVTTDRLNAALVAAKRSLADSTDVTPEAFVAAVAANLGLPVSRVQDAVGPMLRQAWAPRR